MGDKRYSVTRKKSEVGETIVSLELVAKSKTGQTQSQAVQLLEEQVKEQAEDSKSEETVKKKKKKEVKTPEIASYLKNFIKKEGEDVEFKCRLEEEYEEGEVKMVWYFNDTVIEASDKYLITFDGCYASLQMVNVQMSDAGTYKVHFSNSA